MSEERELRIRKKARFCLGLTAGVAIGAAAYAAYKLYEWSKDEYAQEIQFPACCGKSVRISKEPEPHAYRVEFTSTPAAVFELDGDDCTDETVMEIPLPDDEPDPAAEPAEDILPETESAEE